MSFNQEYSWQIQSTAAAQSTQYYFLIRTSLYFLQKQHSDGSKENNVKS